uniref:ANK_REP_REGION domain-containing protein n=1 Tax=Macrostomum lignano TaxID=282301 RepID=A0A1I8FVT4_9PLAT
MNLLPELKSAAMDGRVGKVRQFLRSSVSPDVADDRQRTALHWAAERGQSRVARLLIEAGAQLDAQDSSGATALHLASMHGHRDAVRLLLESEANTSLVTKSSSSALHLASRNGHLEVVQLLSRQADCDQQLADGDSPVHLAAPLGQQLVLAALLLAAADPSARNARGQTPLHSAALHGQRAAIELLVRAGVAADSLASDGSTPLHAAAAMGHEATAQTLLQLGCGLVDLNKNGLSPAAIACRFGHREVLHLLLKQVTHARELGIRHEETNERLQRFKNSLVPAAQSRGTFLHEERPTQTACARSSSIWRLWQDEPDEHKSAQLHIALKESGFELNRVKLQSACSDVLQRITRNRLDAQEYNDCEVYIVGSFSEGWSNSLVRLDGQTDADSDIDVCFVARGMLFHLKGSCSCINCRFDEERHRAVEYEDGHIKWPGSPSNPSQTWAGSEVRPAVDLVWAFRCCCYPKLEVLQPGYSTHIAPSVLQSLRQEMLESPCHLVAAAPPSKDGQQLRISTTFLERRLLRSLTTEQGHVFVLIKFIIKKDAKNFSFHPFLVLPVLIPRPVPMASNLQFHDVYDAIRSILLNLAHEECREEDKKVMMKLARRVPNYAACPKHCLFALIYLKFEMRYAARRVLRSFRYHQVSRGLSRWKVRATDAESELAVWQHLERSSSVWKLLIQADKPPVLSFLPAKFRQHFSLSCGQFDWYYVNFDALLKALSLYLDHDVELELWFEETLRCASPDVQELLVTLELCGDSDLLVQLVQRHRRAICDHQGTREKVEQLMQESQSLAERSFRRTARALPGPESTDEDQLFLGRGRDRPVRFILVKLFICLCSLSPLVFLAQKSRRYGFSIGKECLVAAVRKHLARRVRGSVLGRYSSARNIMIGNCVLSPAAWAAMNLLPELKSAAMDGRVGKVRQFLRSSVSPDVADDRQRTALHWAAERGQSRVARLLIEAGAQLDAQDSSGATALHLASMHGHRDAVRLLLESEANTSLVTKSSSSALHLASRNGHLEVVQLLSRQADCDQQLADGDSPVHLAAPLGQQLVLAALLLAAADPSARNARGQTPLHSAALHGQRAAIELLVRAGVAADSLASDGSTPLHAAAAMGHEATAQTLLQLGCGLVDLNKNGLSPAAIACRFGHREVLHLLLKQVTHARELGIRHEETNERLQRFKNSLVPAAQSRGTFLHEEREQPDSNSLREVLIDMEAVADEPDEHKSAQLHIALKESGFELNRVKLQSACSDVLQRITRNRLDAQEYNDCEVYIVGSFSEGWSNSLVRLDGQTDADSDIDVCFVARGMLFHLKGSCSCINCRFDEERHRAVEYEDGHIKWPGSHLGRVGGQTGSGSCVGVPLLLLSKTGSAAARIQYSHCAISAAEPEAGDAGVSMSPGGSGSPSKDGQQLRISTTFLERRLLRSLTTEQGHVFVLIKFIIKKVISARANGLKTYIAKSLMFYLLDETPATHW